MARSLKTVKRKTVKKENALVTALAQPQIKMTFTENLAPTNVSSGSAMLDYFAIGGALRSRQDPEIAALFSKAFAEDKLLATRCAFYFRDIRGGGQGERRSFRAVLRWLAEHYPRVVEKNLENVPFFGRWDDLFILFGTPVEDKMISLVAAQLKSDTIALKKDREKAQVSILGKWMPSENTSSSATRVLAYKFIHALNLSKKNYRKTLSALRKQIAVVERAMCSGDWTSINYERVPSNASMRYRKAFSKHDAVRYVAYLGEVAGGKKEIKATTLYPYDIIDKVRHGQHDATLELQWKALPDYLAEKPHNGLCVVDVSGSMTGGRFKQSVEPMSVSLSLGLYFAERIQGAFNGYFITFSGQPTFLKVKGNTLHEKLRNMSMQAGTNTNLQAVFDLILGKAVREKIPQGDMPDVIYIVTDTEFDHPQNEGIAKTNFQVIEDKYEKAGYNMPIIVWWNVDSRHNQVAATINDKNTLLVSGLSASVFKHVLTGKEEVKITPLEQMNKVLLSERYERVVV